MCSKYCQAFAEVSDAALNLVRAVGTIVVAVAKQFRPETSPSVIAHKLASLTLDGCSETDRVSCGAVKLSIQVRTHGLPSIACSL